MSKIFKRIHARYIPDEINPYKEYYGKPYYEIEYEENGETFVGFGTYNIDVLSKYLIVYFIDGVDDQQYNDAFDTILNNAVKEFEKRFFYGEIVQTEKEKTNYEKN